MAIFGHLDETKELSKREQLIKEYAEDKISIDEDKFQNFLKLKDEVKKMKSFMKKEGIYKKYKSKQ